MLESNNLIGKEKPMNRMRRVLSMVIGILMICSAGIAATLAPTTSQMLPTPVKETTIKPVTSASATEIIRIQYADKITGSDLDQVVKRLFPYARFSVNSIGIAEVRKSVIDLPNVSFFAEPMNRLEHVLTEAERSSTEHKYAIDLALDVYERVKEMRAGFKDWMSQPWMGGLKNGQFAIILPMVWGSPATLNVSVQVKGISESRNAITPYLPACNDWNVQCSDEQMPDMGIRNLKFEVILTPTVINGSIGYSNVDVQWSQANEAFQPYPNNAASLNNLILNYKAQWMEILRQRLIAAFNAPAVRDKFSATLTSLVKVDKHNGVHPINNITGMSLEADGTIRIQHN